MSNFYSILIDPELAIEAFAEDPHLESVAEILREMNR
ncbi:hypothetical protein Htur_5211 (plasmid) [Haloterrigena turkmenica DSM 5511]|uniref:Uncharacterized protein n=1 Tax=Haloterrigena turkmenica (strain ATCC 51198 / DSM 5511 / JCM 9101 / NCIMB 13204 / VKM B-1734 / 4k) TaxID=543526 RepID=D2S395_HALTV|nr:hypothetical protein Htur_5211 [Haloterrigena turkmenica DSM 5511]